jgi:hypothetical protein
VVITADIMASNGVVHVLDEVRTNLDGCITGLALTHNLTIHFATS